MQCLLWQTIRQCDDNHSSPDFKDKENEATRLRLKDSQLYKGGAALWTPIFWVQILLSRYNSHKAFSTVCGLYRHPRNGVQHHDSSSSIMHFLSVPVRQETPPNPRQGNGGRPGPSPPVTRTAGPCDMVRCGLAPTSSGKSADKDAALGDFPLWPQFSNY